MNIPVYPLGLGIMDLTSSFELDFRRALTVMPMRVVVSTLRLILRRESVLSSSRAWPWSAVAGSDVIFSNCLRIRITSSSTDDEDMAAAVSFPENSREIPGEVAAAAEATVRVAAWAREILKSGGAKKRRVVLFHLFSVELCGFGVNES